MEPLQIPASKHAINISYIFIILQYFSNQYVWIHIDCILAALNFKIYDAGYVNLLHFKISPVCILKVIFSCQQQPSVRINSVQYSMTFE